MRASLPLLALLLGAVALAPAVPRPAPRLSGQVMDAEGRPVREALVRIKGTAAHAHTDAFGHFALPRAAGRLTAWKEGFLIAGGRPPLRLERLPADDNPDYAWVDPTPDHGDGQRCGNCHEHIHREWKAGGHARSATGRHFRDLYADLLREHPDGAGVCASCHAPSVRDDDPALFDLRQVTGVDALGVHCDYCHKVVGPGEGKLGLAHGRFYHQLLRPAKGQLFFGPLDDVDRGEDAYSPFMRDSRYCAGCHEGTIFGVRVYTTYSEWLESPARRQGLHCQGCHMRPTGKMHNVAPGRGGVERDPLTLGNHAFWDGSQEAMLRRCLRLDVRWRRDASGVTVSVRLEASGVGHRVPTGFIDRQLILAVEAEDANGKAVRFAGSALPPSAGRELAGKAGRLYARQARDEKDASPVPFWRALPEPEDTRLSPGVPDERRFVFGGEAARVRVRVLHRRFWAATGEGKGWPRGDLVVVDRGWDVGR